MDLKKVPSAFSIGEITDPKKVSYSINEILNPDPKTSILRQINYEMVNTFLTQTDFVKEYTFIFKNTIIDLKANPIIFLNLMLWNENLAVQIEAKTYQQIKNLTPAKLRRLGNYLWYFIPDNIAENPYTLFFKENKDKKLEIEIIDQISDQANYNDLTIKLETTTEFLENLKELENKLLTLHIFFETEIHFFPEKWFLYKTDLIPKCIKILKYIKSSINPNFKNKNFIEGISNKEIHQLSTQLENYLNGKKFEENPLPKNRLDIILHTIEKIAEKEQEKLYYELEKDYLIKEKIQK